MKISIGNSRFEKIWKLQDISLAELGERLATTTRTGESVAEYRKMSKQQQDNIKDVGGFVAGTLEGGRRKKDAVISRSMLCLDLDYALPTTADELEMFTNFAAFLYSTHKHTPEKTRLRLVVPLAREVSPDEYQAVARMLASDLDIELFDDTTYEPQRLMYWPSTSRDGEYVYRELKGELLNPDAYLSRYQNWKDSSQWPVSSRQQEVLHTALQKQEDPLKKKGIIGAFCRTYSISEAIDSFLSDIYEPCEVEGRYSYRKGESQAGVVLYEDKFAYSHHASDPVQGKLCNAWDIVRLHKYGHLDEKVRDGTKITELPSYGAMSEFASEDAKVRIALGEARRKELASEFSVENENWLAGLDYKRNGQIVENMRNLELILTHDEHLKKLRYNLHSESVYSDCDMPWEQNKTGWSDADFSNLRLYVSKQYGIDSPSRLKDALIAVVSQRAFHPIKEYLKALPAWDGVPRVDKLLVDYMAAEDEAYTHAVTRKTLVAAVARIFEPGVKFDTVLILNGAQGLGKSTLFAKLAGKWFSDSLAVTDMKDKSAAEKLQGYWILELGELAGMRKTEVEVVKSFLSRTDDKYRAAYGTTVESHPRQCIIVGTTNAEEGFLRDTTGNRRFWPVKVGWSKDKKPWDLSETEIAQIWAEALQYYKQKEPLYLTGAVAEAAEKAQTKAIEVDEREGIVREYLERKLPENWGDLSIYERRNWLHSDFGEAQGTVDREAVCTAEIWCECFGKDLAILEKKDSHAIHSILRRIEGWKPSDDTKTGLKHFKNYGRQRAWVRDGLELLE